MTNLLRRAAAPFVCLTLAVGALVALPIPAVAAGAVDVPIVVVLLDFDNATIAKTDDFWAARTFATQEQLADDESSVRAYYDEATYGTYRVVPAAESFGTADDGVVHLSMGESHPGGSGVAYPNDLFGVARRAVAKLDEFIDFAAFDASGDGIVQDRELQIAFVFAGYEGSDSRAGRPAIWANAAYDMLRDETRDGKKLSSYFAQGELLTADLPLGIGTFAHELGHTLGLDDLYDTTGESIGLGASSMMASGVNLLDGNLPAHFDPYSLIRLGAITPQVVTQSATVTLQGSNTAGYNVVKIPITADGSQYFLLENRITEGFDRGLRDDPRNGGAKSGVAIYHVDEWVVDTWRFAVFGEDRGVNTNHLRKGIDLEESDGPALDEGWNSGHGGDHYFYEGGQTEFGPVTYPNSDAYLDTNTNGVTEPSGIKITVSGASGDAQMSVAITIDPPQETPSDFAGGLGTASSPYLIETPAQLDKVRKYPSAHFALTGDLTFAAADFEPGGAFYNFGKGFRVLFGSSSYFTGSLNGRGHSITGLQVNATGTGDTHAGLFGRLSGTVRNLALVDCTFTATSTVATSKAYAGSVAGRAVTALISNVTVVGGSVEADWAGGIVGAGSGTTISDVRSSAEVLTEAGFDNSVAGGTPGGIAGGIAGELQRSKLLRASNTGAVRAVSMLASEPSYIEVALAGGLVGLAGSTTVANSYNTGAVVAENSATFAGKSSAWAAGIAANADAGAKLTDVYNTGTITSVNGAVTSGIAGSIDGSVARAYHAGRLMVADGSPIPWRGAIITRLGETGAIEDCYWYDTAAGLTGYGYGKQPADGAIVQFADAQSLEDALSFGGFDFDAVWILPAAAQHPSPFAFPQLRAWRQSLESPSTPAVTVTSGRNYADLTWAASTTNTGASTRYRVERSTSVYGPYQSVAITTTGSYRDSELAPGFVYYFRVTAVETLHGLTAQAASAATPALLTPPTPAVSATAADTWVQVSWTAVAASQGATKSYLVERATTSGGPYQVLGTTSVGSYRDHGLPPVTSYFYRITAVETVGGLTARAQSTPRSITTLLGTPAEVTLTKVSSTKISIKWTAVPAASGYTVYRATSRTGKYSAIKTTTSRSYTNSYLRRGRTYYYMVKAYRLAGTVKIYSTMTPLVVSKRM